MRLPGDRSRESSASRPEGAQIGLLGIQIMIGSITGDIVGSVFERNRTKSVGFSQFIPSSRFTDDTVLTVAVAKAILKEMPYGEAVRDFAQLYPPAGYGYAFYAWAHSEDERPIKVRATVRLCELAQLVLPSTIWKRSCSRPDEVPK